MITNFAGGAVEQHLIGAVLARFGNAGGGDGKPGAILFGENFDIIGKAGDCLRRGGIHHIWPTITVFPGERGIERIQCRRVQRTAHEDIAIVLYPAEVGGLPPNGERLWKEDLDRFVVGLTGIGSARRD